MPNYLPWQCQAHPDHLSGLPYVVFLGFYRCSSIDHDIWQPVQIPTALPHLPFFSELYLAMVYACLQITALPHRCRCGIFQLSPIPHKGPRNNACDTVDTDGPPSWNGMCAMDNRGAVISALDAPPLRL